MADIRACLDTLNAYSKYKVDFTLEWSKMFPESFLVYSGYPNWTVAISKFAEDDPDSFVRVYEKVVFWDEALDRPS